MKRKIKHCHQESQQAKALWEDLTVGHRQRGNLKLKTGNQHQKTVTQKVKYLIFMGLET